jgi:hypothetical protein
LEVTVYMESDGIISHQMVSYSGDMQQSCLGGGGRSEISRRDEGSGR